MAKKTKYLQGKRVQYKVSHPIYGPNNTFDSWMLLCELTVDLATEYAKKKINTIMEEYVSKLSDEMIQTAEEYEIQEGLEAQAD